MRFRPTAISITLLLCSAVQLQATATEKDAVLNVVSGSSVIDSNKDIAINLTDSLNSVNEANRTIKDSQCRREPDADQWVDKLRASTHSRLCFGASWVDGLFGDDERFQGEKFSGKVSLGVKLDEDDGIDPRLRVRIRAKLPNVSSRIDAFVGRVEEDSFISNTEATQDRLNNVGLRSLEDQDSEWLVGLGYRRPNKNSNGFDYSLGAKLSGGLNPYAKAAHRHVFQSRADRYAKTTNTVFWRKEDGFGVSSNLEYTRYIGDRNIAVFTSTLKYTEEEEQLEWFTDATWHHSLSDRKGISTSIYVRGEQKSASSIPEFGTTFTYIRPILREWLYMEAGIDFRWERDRTGVEYQQATRVGIQFEMLLGDYYRRKRHK